MTIQEKVDLLKRTVAEYYKKPIEVINPPIRRNQPDYLLRWICLYILKYEIGLSLRQLGKYIYKRDDSRNVCTYLVRLKFKMANSHQLRMDIEQIRDNVNTLLIEKAAA